jgi:dimethylargininase
VATLFHHAIVRTPCSSYPHGLTNAELGTPDLNLALEQHRAYCAALEKCGLSLTNLGPDSDYPDSTFVEDTAVLTPDNAILSHPGAPSRQGEVPSVGEALIQHYPILQSIQPPGTLDGGDICQAGDHFFIGISERTNEEGTRQLAEILEAEGFTTSLIDIRGSELLHLKSGIAYLGDKRLVLVDGLEKLGGFEDYNIVPVFLNEQYAANCIRVNDFVLVADGYPKIAARLSSLGFKLISLEMSEFQKMDGGLSCLSLRY